MRRAETPPHPDWPSHQAVLGLADSDSTAGSDAYSLSPAEIDHLEAAAAHVEELTLEAVAALLAGGVPAEFGLDQAGLAMAAESWGRQDKNLISRIDFVLTADGVPRLYDLDALTPHGLLQAGVLQAEWRDWHRPDDRQFNHIHETLVQAWRHFGLYGHRVHFLEAAPGEQMVLTYLRETALQGGVEAVAIAADQLIWNGRRLLDQWRRPITRLCVQRPWQDLRVANLLRPSGVRVIEPAWKALLASPAFLPWLRRRHGEEALLAPPPIGGPILGVWMIASRPSGLGIHDPATGQVIPHFVPG